jgi:hypothetical protein
MGGLSLALMASALTIVTLKKKLCCLIVPFAKGKKYIKNLCEF